RTLALQKTCQATLSGVNYLLGRTGSMQVVPWHRSTLSYPRGVFTNAYIMISPPRGNWSNDGSKPSKRLLRLTDTQLGDELPSEWKMGVFLVSRSVCKTEAKREVGYVGAPNLGDVPNSGSQSPDPVLNLNTPTWQVRSFQMSVVDDIRHRMENLIKKHLQRNPEIADPEGTAVDWVFRDAVRKQFRIFYRADTMSWYYRLPQGRTRGKKCVRAGVLNTLKFVCGDKAQREESEQEPMSSVTDSRGRKRKSCERIRAADSERGDTSFSPDSRVSSEPEGTLPHNYCDSRRASEIYRLRKEVSLLRCSNAGLRSIAEERLERIRQLEAVVWTRQATADGDDGSEEDGSSKISERAEVDEWKKDFEERMEAKEQDRDVAIKELQRVGEVTSDRIRALEEELKASRADASGLRGMLSDIQTRMDRIETNDGVLSKRIRVVEATCQAPQPKRVERLPDSSRGSPKNGGTFRSDVSVKEESKGLRVANSE
ncbi:hypothetical protein FOZ62_024221, partial [Perkinsus olseni]